MCPNICQKQMQFHMQTYWRILTKIGDPGRRLTLFPYLWPPFENTQAHAFRFTEMSGNLHWTDLQLSLKWIERHFINLIPVTCRPTVDSAHGYLQTCRSNGISVRRKLSYRTISADTNNASWYTAMGSKQRRTTMSILCKTTPAKPGYDIYL